MNVGQKRQHLAPDSAASSQESLPQCAKLLLNESTVNVETRNPRERRKMSKTQGLIPQDLGSLLPKYP